MLLRANPHNIHLAAEALKQEKLAILPTETVYGLAADALSIEAVKKIFAAKGRPPDNPLICHIGDTQHLGLLVTEWSVAAETLSKSFWPGPLTLVAPKQVSVPNVVTGGLGTVAVRMPSHPIFREVLRIFGGPIAAPSANLFMGISPTTPADIDQQILDAAAIGLDGGPCEFGIESTVVDPSSGIPAILRPGSITREAIEAALGTAVVLGSSERKSPGMYKRHYAPKSPLRIQEDIGGKPGLVIKRSAGNNQVQMPYDPKGYAASLYHALHALDTLNMGAIYVEAPPRGAEWDAVWDRLNRASNLES